MADSATGKSRSAEYQRAFDRLAVHVHSRMRSVNFCSVASPRGAEGHTSWFAGIVDEENTYRIMELFLPDSSSVSASITYRNSTCQKNAGILTAKKSSSCCLHFTAGWQSFLLTLQCHNTGHYLLFLIDTDR